MNTFTVNITGSTQTLSGNIYYSPLLFKGRSNVVFDFTTLETLNDTILRAKIDYGDNSEIEYTSFKVGIDHLTQPITYYFALYNNYNPLLFKSHIYDPPIEDTYFKSLTAKFYIELASDKTISIFIPIKIAQPSYYDEIGALDIGSTQIVSVEENSIFCTLYDKTGDGVNIILS